LGFLPEIQQKADLDSRCLQIVQQLALVFFPQGLRRLEFDDYCVFHEQVGAIFSRQLALVPDSNGLLTLNVQSGVREFSDKRVLVDPLEKSVPERVVHLKIPLDDLLCYFFVFQHGYPRFSVFSARIRVL
jgi:hypothetical protein